MTPLEALTRITSDLTSTAREIEQAMRTLGDQEWRFASLLAAIEADHRVDRLAAERIAELNAADAEIRKTVHQLSALLTRAAHVSGLGSG